MDIKKLSREQLESELIKSIRFFNEEKGRADAYREVLEANGLVKPKEKITI